MGKPGCFLLAMNLLRAEPEILGSLTCALGKPWLNRLGGSFSEIAEGLRL